MFHLGFNIPLLQLCASYLNSRSQYVSINGYNSKEFPALSGIPQGSNLGPLLFLILINNIQDCTRYGTCLLFADDLKLSLNIRSIADCLNLQSDIDALTRWSVENKLEFNVKKCVSMTYTRSPSPINFIYTINGQSLERVSTVKDLGVVFDPKLTFSDHILMLTSTGYKLLGFVLRTCKQFQNPEAMTSMFNGIVRTKLEYASDVWSPYQQKYIGLIEQIQKKFLRYYYMRLNGVYPKFMHHNDLLVNTNYRSLETRRNSSLMILGFKILRNLIDSPYLLECYSFHAPERYNRARRHDLLSIPHSRTNVLAQHTMTRGMVLLNEVSVDVDIFNVIYSSFKKCVEAFLPIC